MYWEIGHVIIVGSSLTRSFDMLIPRNVLEFLDFGKLDVTENS